MLIDNVHNLSQLIGEMNIKKETIDSDADSAGKRFCIIFSPPQESPERGSTQS